METQYRGSSKRSLLLAKFCGIFKTDFLTFTRSDLMLSIEKISSSERNQCNMSYDNRWSDQGQAVFLSLSLLLSQAVGRSPVHDSPHSLPPLDFLDPLHLVWGKCSDALQKHNSNWAIVWRRMKWRREVLQAMTEQMGSHKDLAVPGISVSKKIKKKHWLQDVIQIYNLSSLWPRMKNLLMQHLIKQYSSKKYGMIQ